MSKLANVFALKIQTDITQHISALCILTIVFAFIYITKTFVCCIYMLAVTLRKGLEKAVKILYLV